MLPFFNAFWTDLQAVDRNIQTEFKLKTGSINDIVHLKLENLDYYLRPALLLAAARAYGLSGERAIKVASVIQFVYLATKVHAIVEDENNPEQNYQFPVLVGDYLYGNFFLYLCKAEALEYLAPISQVICDIHEGGVLRQQQEGDRSEAWELEILEKQEALLFAAACKIGAHMGGASSREQELFWQFGRNLGLGLSAFSHGLGRKWTAKSLKDAKDALNSLPIPVPSLGEIRNYLEGHLTGV